MPCELNYMIKQFSKGGGHWGLSETEKPAKIFTKTKKPEEKSLKTEKNAENNDQNCKFMIFNPSALDTTAKILALGTIQCPCYTACSVNLMRIIPKKIFAMFNQRNRFFHCLRLI